MRKSKDGNSALDWTVKKEGLGRKDTHRQPEKTFRSGDDEWSAIIALHLPPKKVEILRRGCGVHDMHVDARSFSAFVEFIWIVRELFRLYRFAWIPFNMFSNRLRLPLPFDFSLT